MEKKYNKIFLFWLYIWLMQGKIVVADTCSRTEFECTKFPQCIDERKVCDLVKDCKDGSDEKLCRDRYQDDIWDLTYPKRPDADREIKQLSCELGIQTPNCYCLERNKLYCNNAGLREFPSGISSNVTVLDLSGNSIEYLTRNDLNSLWKLEMLFISNNELTAITNNTFGSNENLKKLNLVDNKIHHVECTAFPASNKLEELYLDHNAIRTLTKSMFNCLHRLRVLYLRSNRIDDIEAGTFSSLKSLQILFLSRNHLSRIKTTFFSNLESLEYLQIAGNKIVSIEDFSFSSQNNVRSLLLSNNRLRKLQEKSFVGLVNVTYLSLEGNHIIGIDQNTFVPLTSIKSLDLRKNPFTGFGYNAFNGLENLDSGYFDDFHLCSYTPHVKYCEPFSDGISSKYNLLENVFLRFMVWIVALVSCVGNVVVLFGRVFLQEDNRIHSFYIRSLSMADMFMGIYLFILGSRDIKYRGIYLYFDKEWRKSFECDICGVLCTISNEVSVLTLALITFDRYVSICYPLHGKKNNFCRAYVTVFLIWVIAANLTILPLTGIEYFGADFYGDNSVCFPLHLHHPYAKGWEYSTFIFLAINLAAFTFICYAYTAMFYAIKNSTKILRSHFDNQERNLAKRFFFIVLTDLLCWAPIMVVKIWALAGHEVSGTLYGWFVIFVMPINSAINPLLYTITTKMFRENFLSGTWYRKLVLCLSSRGTQMSPSSSMSSSSCRKLHQSGTHHTLESDLKEVGRRTLRCASERKHSTSFKGVRGSKVERKRASQDYLCFRNRQEYIRRNCSSTKPIYSRTDYLPLQKMNSV